jgi:hypothetical protein
MRPVVLAADEIDSTSYLPEGESIIAQDKRSAVLGQESNKSPASHRDAAISASDASFAKINHLQPPQE